VVYFTLKGFVPLFIDNNVRVIAFEKIGPLEGIIADLIEFFWARMCEIF
jgi:hypothetical protein